MRNHVPFIKMQACGNDFVMINQNDLPRPMTEIDIQKMADRRYGIGCDQVFIIASSMEADKEITIYNADGSQAQTCGNGLRCAALLVDKEQVTFKTASGLIQTQKFADKSVAIHMGAPQFEWNKIPLSQPQDPSHLSFSIVGLPPGVAVNIGNPHVVFFLNDLESFSLQDIGPQIEMDPLFPERTNVEFVQVMSPTHLKMRVWERGAGMTPACGSGACAAAVAAIQQRFTPHHPLHVEMDGGNVRIEWTKEGKVIQSGPAEYCYRGQFPLI